MRLIRSVLSLLRVVGVDLGGDILVANVDFVNLFELLDGFFLLVHLFEHRAEVIDEVFFLIIEAGLFFERVLECARGKVVHSATRKALAKIAHCLEPFRRIALRLLKFLDCLGNLAHLEVDFAKFKSNAQVRGITFGTALALFQLINLTFGFEAGQLLRVIRGIRIQLGQ